MGNSVYKGTLDNIQECVIESNPSLSRKLKKKIKINLYIFGVLSEKGITSTSKSEKAAKQSMA